MKLKVCGMKYVENIAEVASLQPDYMGFIFYEKSARFVNDKTPEISSHIKKTGVFVDASINYILEQVKMHNLRAVQLHGNESPEFCDALRHAELISASPQEDPKPVQVEIIKVFSIKNTFDFSVLEAYESVCDFYLFDTRGELPGGNGIAFDWNVLKQYPSTKPFFLSGGIGLNELDTIKKFIRSDLSTYCYGIDVNSKFEFEAGLKNSEELKKFKKHLSFLTK